MGEIALITGASEGLGAGIATVLAKQGVTVALVARRVEVLEQVAGRIKENGGKALFRSVDVTDKEVNTGDYYWGKSAALDSVLNKYVI